MTGSRIHENMNRKHELKGDSHEASQQQESKGRAHILIYIKTLQYI